MVATMLLWSSWAFLIVLAVMITADYSTQEPGQRSVWAAMTNTFTGMASGPKGMPAPMASLMGLISLVVVAVDLLSPPKPPDKPPERSYSMPSSPAESAGSGMSYEAMVRKAHEDAARANEIVDRAQDQMLEDYRKRSVEHRVDSSGGSRVDMFVMPNGSIVICRTTVRNNARATSCR